MKDFRYTQLETIIQSLPPQSKPIADFPLEAPLHYYLNYYRPSFYDSINLGNCNTIIISKKRNQTLESVTEVYGLSSHKYMHILSLEEYEVYQDFTLQ